MTTDLKVIELIFMRNPLGGRSSLGALSLLIPFLLIFSAVSLSIFEFSDELLEIPEFIKENIEVLGIWAPVVFILLYIPVVLLFIPAWPFSVAGGMLFGMPLAPIYVMVGAFLGGLVTFSIARYLEGGRVSVFLEKRNKRYHKYYRLIEKHGITFVIFLHFALVIPFAGINYLLGVTKISFRSFFVGTFVGLIPGSIFYTYFGFAILEWNTARFVVASFILLMLLLLTFLLKRYFSLKS